MTTSNPTDKERVAALELAKWAHRLAAEVHEWNVSSWNTLSEEARQFWIKRAKKSGFVADALSPMPCDGMRDALVKRFRAYAVGATLHCGCEAMKEMKQELLKAADALASHPDRQPGMTDSAMAEIRRAADAILAPMTMEVGRLLEEAPDHEITVHAYGQEIKLTGKHFMDLYKATDDAAIKRASQRQ